MEAMGNGYMIKNEGKIMMMMMNAKMKKNLEIGPSSGPRLIVQRPDLRTLSVISRTLFFVLFLFALPSIGSMVSGSSHINDKPNNNLVYLVKEGIIKKGDQGLIVLSSETDEGVLVMKDSDVLIQNGIDTKFLDESHVMNGVNVNIPNEALDFVFVQNLKIVEAIDRMIKSGGFVISQLENNKQDQLQHPGNYVVVFLRPIEHKMVVVLRKISNKSSAAMGGLEKKMPRRRSLLGFGPEAKKAALLGLEDAMLEPPVGKLTKSKKLSRKMKFLPDLLKDSLQSYPRRIFFSDGDKSATKWFKKNYPSRGQKFEFYDMKVVANEAGNNGKSAGMLSDWLRNHVKEEDYVVMKAEATLVEEMIKENTTSLVDELFLECKNQWGEEENNKEEDASSGKRSYWQCLALYGRLRDEGVAVHQWWS